MRIALFACVSVCTGGVSAQVKSALEPVPKNATVKHVNEFLGSLKGNVSFETLELGNDLLLEMPGIAKAGLVKVRIASTVSNTDSMWLLSMSSELESASSLLAAVTLEHNAIPDVQLKLNLVNTQSLLLVVHADGKYYGVHREIKIGQLRSDVKE